MRIRLIEADDITGPERVLLDVTTSDATLRGVIQPIHHDVIQQMNNGDKMYIIEVIK